MILLLHNDGIKRVDEHGHCGQTKEKRPLLTENYNLTYNHMVIKKNVHNGVLHYHKKLSLTYLAIDSSLWTRVSHLLDVDGIALVALALFLHPQHDCTAQRKRGNKIQLGHSAWNLLAPYMTS